MMSNTDTKKADGWTKATAAVKSISTAAANSYYFISALHLAFNSQDTSGEEEIQYWEIALGIALSAALTAGDTYSDWVMNVMNQSSQRGEEDITASEHNANINISKNQWLALGCDAVAGAISIASPLAMVVDTASITFHGKPLDRTLKAATLLTSGVLGFLASVSPVRAAKTNIERYNLQEALQEESKRLLPIQAP